MNRPPPRVRLALLILCLLAPTSPAQVSGVGPLAGRESTQNTALAHALFGHYPQSRLITIDLTDGTVAAEILPDLPSQMEPLRIEVDGSDAVWVARRRILGAAQNVSYTTLTRYDFGAPADAYWLTAITLRQNYLAMYSQAGENADGRRTRLTQASGKLTFTVVRFAAGAQETLFTATAASLRELRAAHPAEVRAHLAPMLTRLTGRDVLRPAAADVYRAFDDIPADPTAARRLDDILARLDGDPYDLRERAYKDLRATGPAGVLAALRRDPSDLSAEARNRLDQFIAIHTTLAPEAIPAALRDPMFLLDAMEDDDPAVRAAALQALERRLGRSIRFDVRADAAARADVLDALRKSADVSPPPSLPASTGTLRPLSTPTVPR